MTTQINLRSLLEGDAEALTTFLRDTPLSAFSSEQEALAAILPVPAPPDGDSPGLLGYQLALGTSSSEERFRLPSKRHYRTLRILPGDALRFEIETADGKITRTGVRDLRASMIEWTLRSEEEREAAFDALGDGQSRAEAQDGEAPVAVTSRLFGTLEPNPYSGVLETMPIEVPFCDGAMLDFAFFDVDADTIAAADAAVTDFLALGPADREAAAPCVLEHCHAFLAAVGAESDEDAAMLAITDPRDIWRYVRPRTVQVVGGQPENAPVIHVALICACAWEQEHGLQLVYRGGTTLTRVSDADGRVA